jgi:pimeloyl-ACP methyl ester carboxylesterase
MRRPLRLPIHTARRTRLVSRARALASPLAVAVALAACADTMPTGPDPVVVDQSVMTVPATGIWAEVRRGTTGEGALYEMYVPQGWNGDVVFYAHGVRDVLEPVDLKDQDRSEAIREQLGGLGFAIAASSYSENGYVVKDGAQRTHQLRGLFASQFGDPARSFVMGHSLGGLIAMNLVERFPSRYDGALPVCAVLGGSRPQIDYITNVRALFDVFYGGVLRGSAGEIPEGYVITPADQDLIVAAVTANPAGLAVIASTAQTPLEFSFGPSTQVEMATSLIYALRYHARGVDNVLPLVNGKLPFDNSATVYTARAGFPALVPPPMLAGALAAVNAKVGRWEGDASAEKYMERWFTPSGRLAVPVVTLHNRWDPLVPYFHEGLFRAAVTAAGSESLLEQRTIDRYGHCNIEAAEVIDAFRALVAKADARAAVAN